MRLQRRSSLTQAWRKPPYTTPPPAITQAAYRFYEDGTESGSTAIDAQNAPIGVDVSGGDVNRQVRVRLQSTNGTAPAATDDWQLQWELNTSGTWSNVTAETLLDSYSETNVDGNTIVGGAGFYSMQGQSFLGNGQKLSRVGFWMLRNTATTGTVTARLYAHTGTFGSTGVPTGSPLATSTTSVAGSSFPTTAAWQYFDFDQTYTLTDATPYVIVVHSTALDAVGDTLLMGVDSTVPTAAGNGSQFFIDTATWSTTGDHPFRLYTTGTTVVSYDSASTTDGAATTNRLGAGSGSFVAGEVSEDGLVDDLGWTANNYTELLYSITLKSADLAVDDELAFRVVRNGSTTGFTYTETPSITIVPPVTIDVPVATLTLSGVAPTVTGLEPQIIPVNQATETDTANGVTARKSLIAATETDTAQTVTPVKQRATGAWIPNAGVIKGTQANPSSSFTISLSGPTLVAGDLLVLFLANQGNNRTISAMTSGGVAWTALLGGTSNFWHNLYIKVADGTETQINITQSVGADLGTVHWIVLIIRNTGVTSTSQIDTGNANRFSSGFSPVNPPTVTTENLGPNLFLASAFSLGGTNVTSQHVPAGYLELEPNIGDADFTVGWRMVDSRTEDPGTITLLSDVNSSGITFGVPTGVPTETDTALVITPRKSLGVATETDTAQIIAYGNLVDVGQATETDTAQAIRPVKVLHIGSGTQPHFRGSAANTISTAYTDPQTITAAVNIAVGDLLLILVAYESATGTVAATMAGWTELRSQLVDTNTVKVFARIATGADTAILDFAPTASGDLAAIMTRFSPHGYTSAASVDISSAATGTSANPDPPALDLGSHLPVLWVEMFGADDDDNFGSYQSSGWNQISQAESSQATDSVMVAMAYKVLAGGWHGSNQRVEDPSVMTMAAVEEWAAFTLGLQGPLVSETDTAQAIRPVRFVAVGQATEADSAQAVTAVKTKGIPVTYPVIAEITQTWFDADAGGAHGPFPYPPGTQVGDLVLIFIQSGVGSGGSQTMTATDGTSIPELLDCGTVINSTHLGLYARLITGSEGDVDFTQNPGASTTSNGASILMVRLTHHGVTNTTQIVSTFAAHVASGTSYNPPAITPGFALGRMWFAGIATIATTVGTTWQPSGFTKTTDPEGLEQSNTGNGFLLAHLQSSATTVDPAAGTISGTSSLWPFTLYVPGLPVLVETDKAIQIATPLGKSFSPLVETDTSQEIRAAHSAILGQPSETDTVNAIAGATLTLLTPAHSSTVDVTDGETFTWDHPGTQTDFAFKRRRIPGGTWEWWNGTGWQDTEVFVASATEAVTIGAGDW